MIIANYEYQIVANQATKSIIINNKSEQAQNESQLIILILTI